MRFGRGTTGSMALHFLTAPLLRRGSSCAVGNGGRPGVPPLRRKTDRERWFGKLRRSYGIGPTAILGAAGPQRAGRNRTQALLILRAGNFLPAPRDNPRNGGPGVRRIWTRSVHPEPSPGDPLVTFPSLGKSLAARRRRNSPVRRTQSEPCPLIRHGFAVPPFPIPSVASRHLPLIRGVVLPYDSQEYLLGLGRGGPWASRQDTHRERWLRKPRRMSGTAPAAIFATPGPSGPAGI